MAMSPSRSLSFEQPYTTSIFNFNNYLNLSIFFYKTIILIMYRGDSVEPGTVNTCDAGFRARARRTLIEIIFTMCGLTTDRS